MSAVYPPAGHVDVLAAAKLANLIGSVRVALVVLVLIGGIVVGAMS